LIPLLIKIHVKKPARYGVGTRIKTLFSVSTSVVADEVLYLYSKSMPCSMKDVMGRFVFSKPSRGANAIVLLTGSFVFFSIYAYYQFLQNSPATAALFIATGLGISGLAETLPQRRWQFAGWLRIIAIVTILSLVVIVVTSPEMILASQ
jgi:hypothetical protein